MFLCCCAVGEVPCGSHYNLKGSVTWLLSSSCVNFKAQKLVIKYLFPSISHSGSCVFPNISEAGINFVMQEEQAGAAVHLPPVSRIYAVRI